MSEEDPGTLFAALAVARVRYVLIGGGAVNAHGYRRYTADVDICPDPERANLERLAASRLATRFATLDIMQWVAGIEERAYERLAERAITADVDGVPITVCGLEDLLAMKRAAGRPRDLDDLTHLEPEAPAG